MRIILSRGGVKEWNSWRTCKGVEVSRKGAKSFKMYRAKAQRR